MCLIAFAWRAIPGIRLLVAANRDEYHTRPTAHAAFWQDAPHILGGRDLQDGGTWMGVTRAGRFAALTNHRTQTGPQTAMRSRGHLVADFLRSSGPAQSYCQSVAADASKYNGFNLLAGDSEALAYTGNHSPLPQAVAPGIHTLSNARLNTPWPKAVGLAAEMTRISAATSTEDGLVTGLLDALADTAAPVDSKLPDTGIGLERERMLAPRMIVAPLYGTRSGCVLIVREDGSTRLDERSYDPDGRITREVSQKFGPSIRLPA
jgi:uncharacterized protein with NRDE domain